MTIYWPSGTVSTLEQPTPKKAYEVIEPGDNDGKARATTPATRGNERIDRPFVAIG